MLCIIGLAQAVQCDFHGLNSIAETIFSRLCFRTVNPQERREATLDFFYLDGKPSHKSTPFLVEKLVVELYKKNTYLLDIFKSDDYFTYSLNIYNQAGPKGGYFHAI
ncbi:hypothetical protein [Candidatus Odyssella thessalonicensis]|uniref:hypothetical protein n=1 Tax=Candidatus Odyssella thessalonicensis TaxID=84647 RepID=UPI000225ACCC|nr:hypothetical protein [Candidatus Odyssella thessalonicensis]